jgi:DNA-binding CsgD family transcriptional regulator
MMMVRKSPKPAASIQEIAQAEGLSVSAVNMLLSRGLKKLRALRKDGVLKTARELAAELDRNRRGIVE